VSYTNKVRTAAMRVWLPVFPDDYFLTWFGSLPSNLTHRGSTVTTASMTDASANVMQALFSINDLAGQVMSAMFPFSQGTQYPICVFEFNLVGPGDLANTTLISGAG
jgi:hypothetical protein